jgi:hypothetical protein
MPKRGKPKNITFSLNKTVNLNTLIDHRHGRLHIRRIPGISSRPIAARKAAQATAPARKAARLVYQSISEAIETSHETSLKYRLTEAVQGILQASGELKTGSRKLSAAQLRKLKKFRVYSHRGITVKTKARRTKSGIIEVSIAKPAQQIPPGITYLEYRAVAISPDFRLSGSKTILSNAFIMTKYDTMPELVLQLFGPCVKPALILLEAKAYKLRGGNLLPMEYPLHNAVDIIEVLKAEKKASTKRKKRTPHWNNMLQMKDQGPSAHQ